MASNHTSAQLKYVIWSWEAPIENQSANGEQ